MNILTKFDELKALRVLYKDEGGKKETVAVLFDGVGIEEGLWGEVRELLDRVLGMIFALDTPDDVIAP